MEIPSFFSEKEKKLNFDYSILQDSIDSDIDHSTFIDNLSPPVEKTKLLVNYFKSILQGYNHVYISKILDKRKFFSSSICIVDARAYPKGKAIINVVNE